MEASGLRHSRQTGKQEIRCSCCSAGAEAGQKQTKYFQNNWWRMQLRYLCNRYNFLLAMLPLTLSFSKPFAALTQNSQLANILQKHAWTWNVVLVFLQNHRPPNIAFHQSKSPRGKRIPVASSSTLDRQF